MGLRQAQTPDPRIADAQVGVLGSMLIDDKTVPLLMRTLTPDCFPDGAYRHVFEAIRELWSAQRPVDAVTVLEALGGSAYGPLLRELMELTPTAANCEEYADILARHRDLAAIQSAALSIATDTVTLEEARQKLAEAARLLITGSSKLRRFSYLELVKLFLDRQSDPTPRDWLDLGIPALTSRVHIGQGDFVVIGAYSSVGKTAFALQLARSVACKGKKVAFYSYETNEEHVGDRMMANAASVSLQTIKRKQMTAEDFGRVIEEGSRADLMGFDLVESARMTTAELRMDMLSYGIQVAFIDYVQLIPGVGRRNADRKDIVAESSMELHRMCQELGVTIIALSQVTLPEIGKGGKRRWICMQDLRESKQLLQDAETILLLDMAETNKQTGDRVLIVDKNKDGPRGGMIYLSFDPAHMRFDYNKEPTKPSKAEFKQVTFADLDDGQNGEIPF